MINVLICGISGETGKRIYLTSQKNELLNVVCGVDTQFKSNIEFDCPVYASFEEVKEMVDVIIHFSTPDVLSEVLEFALENNCAIVDGTTGYTLKQKEDIQNASAKIPVFMPTNVSTGVNALRKLCLLASETLGDFDIEIIEEHQACKANAPSMTANMLAEAINGTFLKNKKIISGRKGNGERSRDEICIHSVRGGNLNGKTTIMFIGEGETISITHEVHHRTLFAQGACDVACFITKQKPGIYNLENFYKD